jgi:arsenate reductase
MSEIKIFHNPRCSKSRQALALLADKGEVLVIEYLKEGLTKETVANLYESLGLQSAHEMIRPKEAEYKLAGLSKTSSDEDIFSALVAYPKLLERPVIVVNERAIIARPPEKVDAFLSAL